MKVKGYHMVMTSLRVDEKSQHFYRKLNYQDAGGLLINISQYKNQWKYFL